MMKIILPLIGGLSCVHPPFIQGTTGALRARLLTSVSTSDCLRTHVLCQAYWLNAEIMWHTQLS